MSHSEVLQPDVRIGPSNMLTAITAAKLQLAKASTMDEVLDLRNKADALRYYLKSASESLDAQNFAADVKLRCERKAGDILSNMEKSKGAASQSQDATTLKELGISKSQSSRWQLLASVPEQAYERYVAESIDQKKELTQAGLLSLAKVLKSKSGSSAPLNASNEFRANDNPNWSFLKADCNSLPFEDDQFDLVFCSPPYESQRSYEEVEFYLRGEEYVSLAADCFMECLRVCKGLVAWVIEGVTEDFSYSYTPFLLGAEIQRRGAKLRKPVVYQRQGIPGSGGPDWLRNDWEPIICATKNGKLPWSENTALGSAPKQDKPRAATNRKKDGSRKEAIYHDPEIANPGNVVSGMVGNGNIGWKGAHLNEAPFPEWLAEFFIRSFCPPGGMVLDPFSGGGTTVAVAFAHGRNGVGCDIRESQILLGENRLNELSKAMRAAG